MDTATETRTPMREPHWPAAVAVLVTLGLYVTLPQQLTFGPTWIVPVLAIALLVPVTAVSPHRPGEERAWQRPAAITVVALINAANVLSLGLLVQYLLKGGKAQGEELLVASIKIWLTNVVVFALWYWELDRGGPAARCLPHDRRRAPDFLFPQMQMQMKAGADSGSEWRVGFVDYLYVSFTNATAFSPTDTMPLTPWAKMLMLVQSLASLLTVALVAARAVNILS